MRKVHPPEVLYTPDVPRNPESMMRMRRMMERVVCDSVREIDDAGVRALAEAMRREQGGKRTGEIGRRGDPIIFFTNYKWPREGGPKVPEGSWHDKTLMGLRWMDFRDHLSIRERRNIVCQSGYELHSAYGCLHQCDYCFLGNVLMIGLNLEDLVVHLDTVIDENPWQTLFKFDNQTDNLCFEPEYGAAKIFVEYFAGKSGRYLMLYTKSDNVDHLLDLDHRGKTVVCWTLSSEKAARIYEKGAPSMAERIEAARKCQEAGYTVRFRFSPIIPVKGWREDGKRMIESLFSAVSPDLICIQTLTHMDAAQLRRTLDLSEMDDEILATMDEDLPGDRAGPFPHEVRKMIYEFYLDRIREESPETPVVTCLETPEMWKVFGPRLGMRPDRYVCCCGPSSSPGNPIFAEVSARAR